MHTEIFINKPIKYQEQIDNYVTNHPKGNIFYTIQFLDLYEKTKNYTPITVVAVQENQIIGLLVTVIQKESKGILGYLTSRSIVFGGPLVIDDNPEIVRTLLKSYNKFIKRKAIYTQFRNLTNMSMFKESFVKEGYVYEDHLDIHIDLQQSEETYWKSLKSKLRQNIRKADKRGLKFETLDSKKELKKGYDILEEVYKRAKLPIPNFSFFQNAFDILVPMNLAQFFKASYKGEIIGVRFVLLFNKSVYDWYAGSKQEYYKLYPNDFLPYKTIEWGLKHDEFTLFDFGGAGKPNVQYGVRDHKLKFCDELVNLGRFQKVHSRLLFTAAKIGFKIWKIFR